MDYKTLIAFFDEYNAHYRNFLKFEYSKMDMLNKNEIEKLSASLSAEQAFIMKSNALEKQRLALLGDNSSKTFEQIVSEAPEEYKSRLEEQRASLSEMIYKIKEIMIRRTSSFPNVSKKFAAPWASLIHITAKAQ